MERNSEHLPSEAIIRVGVQIVPHLRFSSGSRARIFLIYCLGSALSVSATTTSTTEKNHSCASSSHTVLTLSPSKSCNCDFSFFFSIIPAYSTEANCSLLQTYHFLPTNRQITTTILHKRIKKSRDYDGHGTSYLSKSSGSCMPAPPYLFVKKLLQRNE